ncbi:hypothetical protein JCM8097_008105 [Rhodosporidiobolus ruineniae]
MSYRTVYDLSALSTALPTPSSFPPILISPSLSTLPPELKVKIAEAALDLVVRRTQSEEDYCGPVWGNEPKQEKQTLARLSAVSRDWHHICAPILYSHFTLTASLLDKPDFLHNQLLRRHGHLIRSLEVVMALRLGALSLSCGFPGDLPILQSNSLVETLQLDCYGMCFLYQPILTPFMHHLRTLILRGESPPPRDSSPCHLPLVTTLSLNFLYIENLSFFARLPVEHFSLSTNHVNVDNFPPAFVNVDREEYINSQFTSSVALAGFLADHRSTLRSFKLKLGTIRFADTKGEDEAKDRLTTMKRYCEANGVSADFLVCG